MAEQRLAASQPGMSAREAVLKFKIGETHGPDSERECWSAGLDFPGWGHKVEFHGKSEQEANELRDSFVRAFADTLGNESLAQPEMTRECTCGWPKEPCFKRYPPKTTPSGCAPHECAVDAFAASLAHAPSPNLDPTAGLGPSDLMESAAAQPPVTPHRSMPGPSESLDSTNGDIRRQPCETGSGDKAVTAAAPAVAGPMFIAGRPSPEEEAEHIRIAKESSSLLQSAGKESVAAQVPAQPDSGAPSEVPHPQPAPAAEPAPEAPELTVRELLDSDTRWRNAPFTGMNCPDWKKPEFFRAAPAREAIEWLCGPDRSENGREQSSYLCSIAQTIEDLQIGLHSQIEITNSERASKEIAEKALLDLQQALARAQERISEMELEHNWSRWLQDCARKTGVTVRYEGDTLCVVHGDFEKDLERAEAELAKVRERSEATRDVLAERARQIHSEGWSAAHDDSHDTGCLSVAAVCYALHAASQSKPGEDESWKARYASEAIDLWPWDSKWWKPKNPRHNLVRAAALLIAEIERIDRAALASATPAKEGQQENEP